MHGRESTQGRLAAGDSRLREQPDRLAFSIATSCHRHASRAMLSRVKADSCVVMVCAWCHALIAGGRVRAGFECNYGMCRACVEEQLARLEPRPRVKRARRHPSHSIAAQTTLPAAQA
jgi:hypothetical protein